MDIQILFSSEEKFKNRLSKTIIIFSFTFVVYSLLIFFIKGSDISEFFHEKFFFEIIKCALLIIPVIFCKVIRWRLICKQINLYIPLGGDIKTWIGSQAFLATPGGAGLGIRSLLLKKKFRIPINQTLPIIVCERIFEFISVILIIILLKIKFILQLKILMPIVALILLIKGFYQPIKNFFKKFLIKKTSSRNINIDFLNSFIKLTNLKFLVICILIGFLPWLIEGYSLYLIINIICQYKLSWSNSLFTHLSATLIGALSFLPGGLGASEFSTLGLLSISKVPVFVSTTSAILIRLLTLWLATIVGIITLFVPDKNKFIRLLKKR